MNKMNQKIGKLLVEVRKQKKLTRKKISELSGFNERTIASYERGERTLSEEYINFIEDYFNIDIKEIIEDRVHLKYYDTFETSVGYALIKNKYKKVFPDNPLLSLIFDSSSFPDSMYLEIINREDRQNINNIILINGLNFQTFIRFYMRDPSTIDKYFNSWLKKVKTVNQTIIIKNDLFNKSLLRLDNSFLGALWFVNVSEKEVILRPVSRNFDNNFDYLIEENENSFEYNKLKNFKIKMTREEFKKLIVIGTSL